jgi:HSP20 family protein
VTGLDVSEDEKGYHITAELPGMSEKDIDVDLSGDTLTIKGEKRDEREEEGQELLSIGTALRLVPALLHRSGRRRPREDRCFIRGRRADPKMADAVKQQKKIEIKGK